jgi:acyl-CoA synthetase (AMP-forming)/AMP-acid ligase II
MAWFSPAQTLLPELIALNGRWFPDKPAIIVDGATVTWSEFGRSVARVAGGLLGTGLAHGDRVVLLMSNSLEMAEAIFGTVSAGLTVVPLNLSIPDEAVLKMIADSGARAVIASDRQVLRVESLRTRLPQPVAEDIARRLFAVDCPEVGDGAWRRFSDLRDGAAAATLRVSVSGGDSCNIIYSSGTTGLPKGIVHSHACRMAWAADMAISLRYHSGARTLVTLGMYSNITWVSMLSTMLAGGTLVIRSRFELEDCLQAIERERVTHFAMVPVQYQRLLDYERFEEYDLSSLVAYMCCGSPLSVAMKNAIRARIPGDLIELYGLTEGLVTILPPEDMLEKIASVGRPCPGQDIRIIDDEDTELPAGQAGEIVGLSRLMMTGYHNNQQETAAATWEDEAGRRWLRTGDIGRLDREGFLHLVDRKKDMIISGGQNVYPADIEAVLLLHGAVNETAVIGLPSRKWGETPVAIVVPRPGTVFDSDEFTAWANSRLGKQQRLAATIVVETLPRNPNGKVLKRELRSRYESLEF